MAHAEIHMSLSPVVVAGKEQIEHREHELRPLWVQDFGSRRLKLGRRTAGIVTLQLLRNASWQSLKQVIHSGCVEPLGEWNVVVVGSESVRMNDLLARARQENGRERSNRCFHALLPVEPFVGVFVVPQE